MLLIGRGLNQGREDVSEGKRNSMFGFEGMKIPNTAQWLSWLERRPVTAEVDGSSPFWVVLHKEICAEGWDLSSAGRASALQAEGHRFEPCRSHFSICNISKMPMWLNWQSS